MVVVTCVLVSSACGRAHFDAHDVDAANVVPDLDAANDSGANTVTYRATVLADSPLAYWRLDDANSTAHDEIGHYDGLYQGTCTQRVAGGVVDDSTAVFFDGATCDVVLPELQFTGNAPFSVEAWVSPTWEHTQPYLFVFDEETRSGGPIDGYAMYLLEGTTIDASFERVTATYSDEPFLDPIPQGSFSHVVAVYDGASSIFYVDGVQVGAPWPNTRSLATVSAPAMIGNSEDGQHYFGAIDEVAIYDHVLSPDHIALHHRIGVGGLQ